MAEDGFLNPETALEDWDIRPGEKVADFGSGAGFFAVGIAQKVGGQGKVYGIDIRQEAIEAARSKARLYHILNIEVSRGDLEAPRGSGLRDDSIDKVLIANILFQAENKQNIASEAFRILKPGGKAVVIEWEDTVNIGPATESKMSKSKVRELFEELRFAFMKEVNAGSHHFGLIFQKP